MNSTKLGFARNNLALQGHVTHGSPKITGFVALSMLHSNFCLWAKENSPYIGPRIDFQPN